MKSYGEKIRTLRKSKGLTQSDLAAAVRISQVAFAKIENGTTKNISVTVAKGIAKTLKVSFIDIFEIEEDYSEINKLREEVDELKKDSIENDKVVEILNMRYNNLKDYFTVLFVSDVQHTLSNASNNPERKDELTRFFNKQYVYFMKRGFLKKDEIMEQTSGLEGAYKDFLEWYDQFK